MMNESMSFAVLDENDGEVKCKVQFIFESEGTGKSYIVYTDNSVDAEGNTQVYVSIYGPESNEQKLMPIETEKEWKIIEIILTELQSAGLEYAEQTEMGFLLIIRLLFYQVTIPSIEEYAIFTNDYFVNDEGNILTETD